MAEIIKPNAYFRTVVRNSDKNEYRSNDNYFNYISSVGGEADIQRECSGEKVSSECGTDHIEQALSETSAKNWLLFMKNEQLHIALSSLPISDVEFLLALAGCNFNKSEYAQENGISQQAVSKRFHKLKKIILENL